MNMWPGGKKRALTQAEHERWNATHYPGTRQLCALCGDATGRCEEDAYRDENGEPLCHDCYHAATDETA